MGGRHLRVAQEKYYKWGLNVYIKISFSRLLQLVCKLLLMMNDDLCTKEFINHFYLKHILVVFFLMPFFFT